MATISGNIQQVRARIEAACIGAKRPVRSVTLLAVSKFHPADAVREAAAAGATAFGENYVQEALAKIEALADLRPGIEWHLIGPLQANKTRAVAQAFDWVHTVDRPRVAERLSTQRPDGLPPLQVCLQVNVDGEASKSGLAPDEVPEVAAAVARLPRLRLRGLMSIPEPSDDPAVQHRQHAALRRLLGSLQAAGLDVDTLSMGMSADLEAAVEEGATLVRIGTAIFGERPANTSTHLSGDPLP